jgi:beta-lactamase superfamily II metal-dependent hydrolase
VGYEVDFLPVGEGKKSGDAIVLRYGNLAGPRSSQSIVVIDGGTKESGKRIVEWIASRYGTDTVDIVVSTHPDTDHTSGLTEVLTNLRVGALLMHLPWNHAENIRHLLQRTYSVEGLKGSLRRGLDNVRELERIATRKGIPIYEPFSDASPLAQGPLRILGPTVGYYDSLLCDFQDTPDRREGSITTLLTGAANAVRSAVELVNETFYESLDDSGETRPENNSSVILHLTQDGRQALFTADAGMPALTQAADFASGCGIDLRQLTFLQVPHHGSRRNVGPTILNRMKANTAFISVCRDGAPKHPSRRVMNALVRRGNQVHASRGAHIWHTMDAPPRPGSPLVPEQLVTHFYE